MSPLAKWLLGVLQAIVFIGLSYIISQLGRISDLETEIAIVKTEHKSAVSQQMLADKTDKVKTELNTTIKENKTERQESVTNLWRGIRELREKVDRM